MAAEACTTAGHALANVHAAVLVAIEHGVVEVHVGAEALGRRELRGNVGKQRREGRVHLDGMAAGMCQSVGQEAAVDGGERHTCT